MRQTRRTFLQTAGPLVAASSCLAKEKPEPRFAFGLLADCQYVDADSRGSRHYRESPHKLREAIEELNRHDLAFTFHVGDFIDRDFRSFEGVLPVAAEIRSDLHHVLGNHDFSVGDEEKAKVPEKLGLERGHYSLRKDGVRFVVLDTTATSLYRNPAGTAAHEAAKAELAQENPNPGGTKSCPGKSQIEWLEKELGAASDASEAVILIGHHPIVPRTGHALWTAGSLHELLLSHSCVKVYLNGHNHAGAYKEVEGLHYLTLDGMVETKDKNSFAYAEVFADRLQIHGYERQESHALEFR